MSRQARASGTSARIPNSRSSAARRAGVGEFARAEKQMQDALAQPIELDAGFAQQGVQAIPAVQGEPDDGEGVEPGAARQALDQEPAAPAH
ncbi:MAG: hypothetical protein IPO57_06460 [Rhodocyclales bacterium]|nr:hypothetical protein [Rhodocyclales bacterium]